MKLIVHQQNCVGCRVCEVVCSFHHHRTFSRKRSSIRVKKNERKAEFEPAIFNEGEDKRPACDLCDGEKVPLCVKFCPTKALTVRG